MTDRTRQAARSAQSSRIESRKHDLHQKADRPPPAEAYGRSALIWTHLSPYRTPPVAQLPARESPIERIAVVAIGCAIIWVVFKLIDPSNSPPCETTTDLLTAGPVDSQHHSPTGAKGISVPRSPTGPKAGASAWRPTGAHLASGEVGGSAGGSRRV